MDGSRDQPLRIRRGRRKKLRADPELLTIYSLADRLQMTVAAVMEMTIDEYAGWLAYAKIMKERRGGGS